MCSGLMIFQKMCIITKVHIHGDKDAVHTEEVVEEGAEVKAILQIQKNAGNVETKDTGLDSAHRNYVDTEAVVTMAACQVRTIKHD